ncbi:MAG: hypothetical protein Q8R82_09625 [Hyphomonadaceae bacterium]|nr:hypothetical protein [Hyphomonadaceae bacterium]
MNRWCIAITSALTPDGLGAIVEQALSDTAPSRASLKELRNAMEILVDVTFAEVMHAGVGRLKVFLIPGALSGRGAK